MVTRTTRRVDYFSKISYLMLEANSSCNLACAHCNRADLERAGLRDRKNMTPEELRRVLSMLTDCPIDTIKFEGLSEPMLHPEFDSLTEILRGYFPRAYLIVATNLQYNVLKTPLLKTIPLVDMMYLSIDGVGETYEKLRSGASYDKLLESLRVLKENVSGEDRARRLHINFTLCPDNYYELPEIYKLKDEYGLAGVRINLAQNWNEQERNSLAFTAEILEFLKPYRKDVKGVGGWEYKDCFWPFNGIIIDVFGDMRQCIINTSMTPIGNVFRDDIRELYNNATTLNDTRAHLSRNEAARSCVNCDYKLLSPLLEQVLGGKYVQNTPRAKVTS